MVALPNKVTRQWLREAIDRLADHLDVELTMVHNSYVRWAVFIERSSMITPGYLSNRELACWIAGVWLQYDKAEELTIRRYLNE